MATNEETSQEARISPVTAEERVDAEPAAPAALSKRALKRRKKEEEWLAGAEERKRRAKEKKKAKKLAVEQGLRSPPLKRRRDAVESGVRVALDMGFEKYMSDKDLVKLIKQAQRCYSENGRVAKTLELNLCSLDGRTKSILAKRCPGFVNWKAKVSSEPYYDVFDKEKIVYLSSESPNTLHTLEEGMVYVIGGLVDHNHQKGLCHQLAVERGIAHAKLPLDDFVHLQTRRVLTINQVYEILLAYVNSGNWRDALISVIPQRKGAVVKDGERSAEKTVVDGVCENDSADDAAADDAEQELGSASDDSDSKNGDAAEALFSGDVSEGQASSPHQVVCLDNEPSNDKAASLHETASSDNTSGDLAASPQESNEAS